LKLGLQNKYVEPGGIGSFMVAVVDIFRTIFSRLFNMSLVGNSRDFLFEASLVVLVDFY